MEIHYAILLGALASFCFVYYPTGFLVELVVWLLQQYLLNEPLLRAGLERSSISSTLILPGREDFLTTVLRPLMGLANDDCIICRDEPIEPVQTPCNHVFCRNCFMEWINRGHQRCPFCTTALFVAQSKIRAWEANVKLAIAAYCFSAPLGTIHLIVGTNGWTEYAVLISASIFSWGMVFNVWACRAAYGASWWEHIFPELVELAVNDRPVLDVFGFFCYGAAIWTLVMAMAFDAYLPSYYLYNALCVA